MLMTGMNQTLSSTLNKMVAKWLERVWFTHRSSTEGERVRGGLLKMPQN